MKISLLLFTIFWVCTSANLPPTFNTTSDLGYCGNYLPYHKFAWLMKVEKYSCYGKPAENPQINTCSLKGCKNKYVLQSFCKAGEITTTFYYAENACRSKKCTSGYHDNLSIGITEPCVCDDDNISVDYN